MKVVAAYLLAVLGGNTSPSADDIKSILGSVGADGDDEKLEFLLSQLEGKDITEVIAAGREKFASVPSDGGVWSQWRSAWHGRRIITELGKFELTGMTECTVVICYTTW